MSKPQRYELDDGEFVKASAYDSLAALVTDLEQRLGDVRESRDLYKSESRTMEESKRAAMPAELGDE